MSNEEMAYWDTIVFFANVCKRNGVEPKAMTEEILKDIRFELKDMERIKVHPRQMSLFETEEVVA
jgi:RNA-binding protein YhbY